MNTSKTSALLLLILEFIVFVCGESACPQYIEDVEYPVVLLLRNNGHNADPMQRDESSKEVEDEVSSEILDSFSPLPVSMEHPSIMTSQRKNQTQTLALEGVGAIVGDIQLRCFASYPIQWGFSVYPKWVPWSVSSGRKLITRNSSLIEKEEIFISMLNYKLRNLTQIKTDLPVCYKSIDQCIQTSINPRFDVNEGQTVLIANKGTDFGINADAEFGKNVNCSLKMGYDESTGTFYCQSAIPGQNITIFPRTCANPVMCSSVAMEQDSSCSISEPIIPFKECTEENDCVKMTYANDLLPGAAICLIRGVGDQQPGNGIAMPFIYSLLPSSDSKIWKRYIRYKDIEEGLMLNISISNNGSNNDDDLNLGEPNITTKFAWETFSISCNSSYYYFGEGGLIKIERIPDGPTGDEGFINNDNQQQLVQIFDKNVTKILELTPITPVEGIMEESTIGKFGANIKLPFMRTLKVLNYSIPYPGSYRISCQSPVWNDTKWVSRSITLHIKESIGPKFSSGNGTETLYYKADKSIDCSASGIPLPTLKWSLNDLTIPRGFRIYKGQNNSRIWTTLNFPNSAHGVYGNFTCTASNYAGTTRKTFVVIPNDKNSSTAIIIIAILGALGLILIPMVVFLVWKVKSQQTQLRNLTPDEVEEFLLGKPDYIPFQCDMSTYAYYLPYDTKYEIQRQDLFIDWNRVLGTGAYGMVVFGRNKTTLEQLAIKTAKPLENSVELFKALLSELKIMTFIGKHANIVNLIGACTDKIEKREVLIALELCENGSLLSFMRTHRHTFINPAFQPDADQSTGNKRPLSREPSFVKDCQVQYVKMEDLTQMAVLNQNEYANAMRITRNDLVRWAHEAAEGMAYLQSKKVIHGDLAARNVLLSMNLVCKIGDFGLSKRLMHYNSYTKTATTPVPIKWMAIECLQDFQFSAESDIWSYGVLLWEIFSLGEIPYASFNGSGEDFLKQISRGMRLQNPPYASPDVFDVMMKCWKHDRKQRPKFPLLSKYFKECLETPAHAILALRLSSILAGTNTSTI